MSKLRFNPGHLLRRNLKIRLSTMRVGALALLCGCAGTASAQNYQDFLNVTSTTDGNGLYSYTFSLGNQPFVWGLGPDSGNFYLQSHGILEVITPPGWGATVDANEGISLQPISGLVFIGEPPVTFSVLSSSTQSVLYDGLPGSVPYPSGVIVGGFYTYPDHQHPEAAFMYFPMVGPQEVPEPASFELLVFAALIGGGRRLCAVARQG
jgi:hypothetical protein